MVMMTVVAVAGDDVASSACIITMAVAVVAVQHAFFKESPLPASPSDLPKFPSSNEGMPTSPVAERQLKTASAADGAGTPVAGAGGARDATPETVFPPTPVEAWDGLFADE
jgi:hypothetical protein